VAFDESPLIQLHRVDLTYGEGTGAVRALAGVDLRVGAGERVALLGPSGAGKTTLLRLVGGRLRASRGRVTVLGHDMAELGDRSGRAVRRRIGTVDQDLALTGALRVRHNVNGGRLGEWSTWRALASLVVQSGRAEVDAALASVDAGGLADARTDELSGGQRQRVAIARLLVQDPDVVLADEPAASLDPELGHLAVSLLAERVAAPGRALVMSIHDPALALTHCDRIIGMRAGRVVFDRPAAEVGGDEIGEVYRR
jgi:phosphonate transport system ATP-binding protein